MYLSKHSTNILYNISVLCTYFVLILITFFSILPLLYLFFWRFG